MDAESDDALLAEAGRLAGDDDPGQRARALALAAAALAEAAGGGASVRVALLRLLGGEEFVFAHPPELRSGNRFPASPSLAGRALREGALIENAVPRRPHFSLYERIPQAAGEPLAIQRMLALPIPGPEGAIGVAEISRVGDSPEAAGPGFERSDAARVRLLLERLAPSIATAWRDPESG